MRLAPRLQLPTPLTRQLARHLLPLAPTPFPRRTLVVVGSVVVERSREGARPRLGLLRLTRVSGTASVVQARAFAA